MGTSPFRRTVSTPCGVRTGTISVMPSNRAHSLAACHEAQGEGFVAPRPGAMAGCDAALGRASAARTPQEIDVLELRLLDGPAASQAAE
jgi:hypothetical protein